MKYFFLSLLFLLSSCATNNKQVDRKPSSFLPPNYTCSKILSWFFPNPYKKKYTLKEFTYDEAIKAFNKNVDKRAGTFKLGSRPFMRLQTSKKFAPTRILLHGYSDSPASMRELAEMWYQRGYHVIAPLYNDHGLKKPFQKEALDNSSLNKWREDVDFAAAIAKALSGDGKVHIDGYSMGATLAFDFSLRFPELVASRSFYAPLFKENGFVIQPGLVLLNNVTSGSFEKKIAETSGFYKLMTYKQTIEMHRLTRQIQPHLLRKRDNIPTAVFRVDEENEQTVDDGFINAFIRTYEVDHHYIFQNTDIDHPVLHRDFTSPTVNSSGAENPALETIYEGIEEFHQFITQ